MVTSQITITKMQVGDYEVPVPHGLSDLLNAAGAWGIKEDHGLIEGYDRDVIKQDGHFITRLTKREVKK